MSVLIKNKKWVEYICTHCGAKVQRRENTGRPDPGFCSRRGKSSTGLSKPHVWVINRKY